MSFHVTPVGDLIDHDTTSECVCGPAVEWIDPDTGGAYPSGPVVVHNSLDGRESREDAA